MSQVDYKDIEAIRSWLAKEPHLPKNFDDKILSRFLFSCHSSLEKTKKCIEIFCTGRATMHELYTNRDPLAPAVKTALESTCVTVYGDDVNEILIHKLLTIENFDFYDLLKSMMVRADIWITTEKVILQENQIIIMDIKEYTLSIVAKSNIFYFQKLLIYLLEAMPVRLKQVHVVNCPSFYEYMYGLVKGVLPQDIRDLIHFHSEHTALHKFIDKKLLPSEYGGEAESMIEQDKMWRQRIYDKRKFYLDENMWKADVSKKAKETKGVEVAMSGSFRSLAID